MTPIEEVRVVLAGVWIAVALLIIDGLTVWKREIFLILASAALVLPLLYIVIFE